MADKTEKPAQTVAETFKKRGKLILDLLRATPEAKAAFQALATSLITTTTQDWSAKAPEFFTTAALIQPEDEKLPARLIAISDKDHVFADPIVSQRLYQAYVNRVASAAVKDDADPADFIIVSGTYRQAHDMSAFQFQTAAIVSALKAQGVAGMTTKLLRQCLENAAFARSMFPRITDQSWDLILGIMVEKATARGMDTSVFAHWAATRQVKIDTGTTIDLSGFGAIVEEKLEAKEEAATAAEGEAQASAQPVTAASPAPATEPVA